MISNLVCIDSTFERFHLVQSLIESSGRKVEEIKLHSWDEFDIKYLTVIYCEHKEVYLPVAVDDQLTVRRLCSFQIHAFRKHKATR